MKINDSRAGKGVHGDGDWLRIARHVQDRILRDYLDVFSAARIDPHRRGQLKAIISQILLTDGLVSDRNEREWLSNSIGGEIVGLGPIDPPIHDPEVTEIMVNGPSQVFVEKRGRLQLTELRFRDDAHLLDVVRRIIAPMGRRIDQSSPMVDARLRDGSRVNAIIPPVAVDGPVVTIRKFTPTAHDLDDLVSLGSLTPEVAEFLCDCVRARLNMIVCGSTGSGKTTVLNVISEFIEAQRVITIEDAAELSLKNPHVVRLECRPGNLEGKGEVSVRQLVRNALRMRPDRIIIGECRGAEAFDMLQAMNTGHEGSMATIHSNGSEDALRRLEAMVIMADHNLPLRAIRDQIISAIDCVVHLVRQHDGSRIVHRVSLLDRTCLNVTVGLPPFTLVDLFSFCPFGSGLSGPANPVPGWCTDKFERAGLNVRRWEPVVLSRAIG